ncbi:MAG TPA: excinuclease ABC subunit UvrB [Candidatus Deferrimicrobium sp.]|nr:excinuclease ABC subunit UvrB [Candidatus Deferrimicrobium sp.]
MPRFQLEAPFQPTGDQPEAIACLAHGLKSGLKFQTLLGGTGTGKTFSMANIIQNIQKPTLIISHNKTLAAQLYREYKDFFPHNAVEYFVSYYDYYQPEAYLPSKDLYIAKETSRNPEIAKLRLSTIQSILTRTDVIVIASVSCIYGLADPQTLLSLVPNLEVGQIIDRDKILQNLVTIQYRRNDLDFKNGTFRVRGDTIDINPATGEIAIRIEMFGDEIERILSIDPLTGKKLQELQEIQIYPSVEFISTEEQIEKAIPLIEQDLETRILEFEQQNKKVEAQRLRARTKYDLELLRESGWCPGIENYTVYLTGQQLGEPPYTLIDYFPKDFLMIIDESHVTIPQLEGMYYGNYARKKNLVDYGFRLLTAHDNRPLKFEEFQMRIPQIIFTSATPGSYELEKSQAIVEQLIRPTNIVDPELEIRPIQNQVEDLIQEIQKHVALKNRVLVTTLTKRMAEHLTEYLVEQHIHAQYLHSEIDTIERTLILRDLRLGSEKGGFDVLVGINLLREGLDLPEVSLVAILDADKEGFLRSETALIQTIGRASRNIHGKVILYADTITNSMERAIEETNRRRQKQIAYNLAHNLQPIQIIKPIRAMIDSLPEKPFKMAPEKIPKDELPLYIQELEKGMYEAAQALEFEKAAAIRDKIQELRKLFS